MKIKNLIAISAIIFSGIMLSNNNATAQAKVQGNEAMVSSGAPSKITQSELTGLIADFKSTDNNKSFQALSAINEKLMTTLAIQKNEIKEASESGKPAEKLAEVNRQTINFYNMLNGADANHPDGTLNKEHVLNVLNQLNAYLFK